MFDSFLSKRAQRYVFISVNLLILTALLFAFGSHPATRSYVNSLKPSTNTQSDATTAVVDEPALQLENATFVTLCREGDIDSALNAVQSWEDRFNSRFHYNWVFLNDKEFSKDFKDAISSLASGNVQFGVVGTEMWEVPKHIDGQKAKDAMAMMKEKGILYGDSIPYRQMCRFFSGFFQDHELLKPYKYFWRVDPDTALYCNIDYDVFRFMRENNKQYGFVITFREFRLTVATLWKSVTKFLKANPQHVHPNSGLDFVKYGDRDDFNMCHFWTNFEIGDMDFFRSEAYRAYFQSLDEDGGFFYERWGDAPVHSIAVATLMDRNAVHFFEDVGYRHGYYHRTPDNYISRGLKCSQRTVDNVDWMGISCLREANTAFDLKIQNVPKAG